MTKDNVTTQTEEFDRSICMSFFNDHRELVKRIERLHGIEMAYKVQNAIIDYGLDGIKPTEEELLQFIPEPVLNQIDNNQKRRAKSFKGEDLEISRSIILFHRDHPEMSQNAIVKALGFSKGKVNKTLQKYNNGEYEGIIDFTDTFTNTSTNTITSNDRDQRDRLTVHSTELADAQTVASLQTASLEEIDFKSEMKGFTNESLKTIIDKKIIELLTNDYTTDSIIDELVKHFTGTFYKCNKESVIQYITMKLKAE